MTARSSTDSPSDSLNKLERPSDLCPPYFFLQDFKTYDLPSSGAQRHSHYYEKVFRYLYEEFHAPGMRFHMRGLLALKAIGNMARGDRVDYSRSFFLFFRSIAFDARYPMQYRLAMFEYFGHMAQFFYEEVRECFVEFLCRKF